MQSVENFIKALPSRSTFASITLESEVKMNKKGNPFTLSDCVVTYVATYSILTNVVYSNMVNNQLEREDKTANFTSQSLWKGKGQYYHRSNIGPLAHHIDKGTKYLSYSPQKLLSFKYFVNGRPATQTEQRIIKAFLPKKKENTNQGTEKEIKWRLVKLDNINQLTANKNTWQK